MKTIADLEQDILDITMKINTEFPELSKYIIEVPVQVSEKDTDAINNKDLKEYHNSLIEIVKKYSKTHVDSKEVNQIEKNAVSVDPIYRPAEDIYKQEKNEVGLDPDDLSQQKAPNQEAGLMNEKSFGEDMSGDDLDISGSELDDQQESLGSEDEENNYYSLGGDNHNDLEEDNV